MALVTVDLINDLIHPHGAVATCAPMVAEREVLTAVNRALSRARKAGLWVAHVRVALEESPEATRWISPMFGAIRQRQGLRDNTWGTEFHSGLERHPDDPVFTKRRVSPFFQTGLEEWMRSRGVQWLWVSGVSTPFAVEAAIRDGHDRDFGMGVLIDGCAAASVIAHEAALSGPLSRLSVARSSEEFLD